MLYEVITVFPDADDLLDILSPENEMRGTCGGKNDVGPLQMDRNLVEPDRDSPELLGELYRALEGPVGHQDSLDASYNFV